MSYWQQCSLRDTTVRDSNGYQSHHFQNQITLLLKRQITQTSF